MSYRTKNRVLETSITTGTVDMVLAGAVAGFRAVSSVYLTNGDKFPYLIEGVDSSGAATGEWENGTATYNSSTNAIARSPKSSSNSGALVSFSAGTKQVSCSLNAEDNQVLPALQLGSDATNSSSTVITDLTGMTFDAEASATYIVELQGEIQAAATTTGVGFCLTGPTGVAIFGQWEHMGATSQASTIGHQVATGVVLIATSGVPAATTSYPVTGKWRVTTSTTEGAVKLSFRTEINASQVTAKAGMVMTVKRVL